MPAESRAQRNVMAWAEHDPSTLPSRFHSLLSMTHQQLHDFSATKEKGLPENVKRKKRHAGLPRAAGGR